MAKPFVTITILVMAVAIGSVMAIRMGAFNPTDEYLKIRYSDARSRFFTIDGVSMHVVEEGEGPAIILIHGHLGRNRQWDGWVDELRKGYRVFLFDYPPFGLSGPDPTGEYSSARAYVLLEKLIDELKYERFHIGGTSSGSLLALRYAADYPERVEKLLLSTVPAYSPGDCVHPHWTFTAMMWFSDTILKVWRPELYWRMFLENIFGNPDRITPTMVKDYYDLNSRLGAIANVRTFILANARSAFDLKSAAARITAPTLIQWAGKSPVLASDGLDRMALMFTNTSSKTIRYPNLGHKLMLEEPVRIVADVRAFLLEE